MKQLTTRSETDDIIAHLQFTGEPEKCPKLSKKLQDKLKRLYRCADLIKAYGSRLKVAPMLENEFGISRATAYRDFQDTQVIFGTTLKSSKDFWLDVLLGMMMESRTKAMLKNDFRSVAAIEKNMTEAIKKLAGDQKTLPFDQVQPVSVMIGFFPELTKVELPDNLEEQVAKLLKNRKTKQFDDYQDAVIITDTDGE
jgi:hypothetical protein